MALLMHHGIDDANVGTNPINAEHMFMAPDGLGKPAALSCTRTETPRRKSVGSNVPDVDGAVVPGRGESGAVGTKRYLVKLIVPTAKHEPLTSIGQVPDDNGLVEAAG